MNNDHPNEIAEAANGPSSIRLSDAALSRVPDFLDASLAEEYFFQPVMKKRLKLSWR
jgi:hypothetical protein